MNRVSVGKDNDLKKISSRLRVISSMYEWYIDINDDVFLGLPQEKKNLCDAVKYEILQAKLMPLLQRYEIS